MNTSEYRLEIITALPAELYGIGVGLTMNELSVKESEQSRGEPITVIESLLKKSFKPSGFVIAHLKQNVTVYPSMFVSVA